jgi:hypothetical protein
VIPPFVVVVALLLVGAAHRDKQARSDRSPVGYVVSSNQCQDRFFESRQQFTLSDTPGGPPAVVIDTFRTLHAAGCPDWGPGDEVHYDPDRLVDVATPTQYILRYVDYGIFAAAGVAIIRSSWRSFQKRRQKKRLGADYSEQEKRPPVKSPYQYRQLSWHVSHWPEETGRALYVLMVLFPLVAFFFAASAVDHYYDGDPEDYPVGYVVSTGECAGKYTPITLSDTPGGPPSVDITMVSGGECPVQLKPGTKVRYDRWTDTAVLPGSRIFNVTFFGIVAALLLGLTWVYWRYWFRRHKQRRQQKRQQRERSAPEYPFL